MTDTAPDVAAIRAALDEEAKEPRFRDESHDLGCVCYPERIARLLDALEAAQKDAERWRWLRANFATHPATVGLHACETPDRLDAHFDAAMKKAP